MTVAKIQSGFRKTGVFPTNFNAIDNTKFAPAQVTGSMENSSMFVEFQFQLLSTVPLYVFNFVPVPSKIAHKMIVYV